MSDDEIRVDEDADQDFADDVDGAVEAEATAPVVEDAPPTESDVETEGSEEALRPGLQVPLEGRQEELPLVEVLSADALPAGETIGVDDLPMLVPDTTDLPPAELRAVIEALLFVVTRPLTVKKLQECLPGTSDHYLEGFLAGLAERYDAENRGWELRRIAGGWQLLTRRSLYPWVRQLDRKELPTKLSKSALETLAIVAYKQPITRGEVEDIRGVQCGPVLRQLMDLKLVQVTGRSEHLLGRPLLYATTDQFLTRFGLGSVDDLPKKHEFGA